MITLDNIRKKMTNAIIDSGLKQIDLAKQLGIKQPTLSQYLSGRAMPALDTFANLCKILDLDPAEILCIKNKTDDKIIEIKDSFNNNNGKIDFKA